MANRGGILFRLCLLLTVAFAGLALAWMLFLPEFVAGKIRDRTGFEVRVNELAANPFTGRISVRGLTICNPSEFSAPDFLQLSAFDLEGAPGSYFSDRWIIDRLQLDVAKVELVRGADGRSNLAEFEDRLLGPPPPSVPARGAAAGPPARPHPYLVRHLTLRFGDLVTLDAAERPPVMQDFRLRLDRTYENISDVRQILVPDVLRQLGSSDQLARLAAMVPGEFGRTLAGTTRDAARNGVDLIEKAGRESGNAVKSLLDRLEEKQKQ